jgi:hypothetical protein
MVERRKHRRVLLEVYVVLDMLMYGQARNVSENGMCVRISGHLEKGSIVHVKFTLPDAQSVSLIGNVAWAKEAEDGKLLCGLEFLDFSNNDREIVRNYTEARIKSEQKSA